MREGVCCTLSVSIALECEGEQEELGVWLCGCDSEVICADEHELIEDCCVTCESKGSRDAS